MAAESVEFQSEGFTEKEKKNVSLLWYKQKIKKEKCFK